MKEIVYNDPTGDHPDEAHLAVVREFVAETGGNTHPFTPKLLVHDNEGNPRLSAEMLSIVEPILDRMAKATLGTGPVPLEQTVADALNYFAVPIPYGSGSPNVADHDLGGLVS